MKNFSAPIIMALFFFTSSTAQTPALDTAAVYEISQQAIKIARELAAIAFDSVPVQPHTKLWLNVPGTIGLIPIFGADELAGEIGSDVPANMEPATDTTITPNYIPGLNLKVVISGGRVIDLEHDKLGERSIILSFKDVSMTYHFLLYDWDGSSPASISFDLKSEEIMVSGFARHNWMRK